jgi:hypothetical protein
MQLSPDLSLSPENVTLSVGDNILTTFTSSMGLRIPDAHKPVMEVSWAGAGTLLGNTNISDFGTVWVQFGVDGKSKSHGHGMIMNQKGEVLTYSFEGRGAVEAEGNLRNYGTVVFDNSTSNDFSTISNTVAVFADQINQNGNTVTKIWELKR